MLNIEGKESNSILNHLHIHPNSEFGLVLMFELNSAHDFFVWYVEETSYTESFFSTM
uniref:Uncharacterized protein n=1 Tax=Arundo donax TaxID=35708 RepID=A0A0A9GY40_ARUDO